MVPSTGVFTHNDGVFVFVGEVDFREFPLAASLISDYRCLLLIGELEHLKIKTRLVDERFASVMGECVIVTL